MATIVSPPEERTILHDVPWATYEQYLADTIDQPVPRFTYDRGTMEILVTISIVHERSNRTLTSVVELVSDEWGLEFINAGSMTFRRADLKQGFEPDTCLYIQNEWRIRHRVQIDPRVDPPPDLVIEIDVSRQSLNKLPVYAGFGVPEVWRVRDGAVIVYTLRSDGTGGYDEGGPSRVLPPLDGETLTRFLVDGFALGRAAWVRSIRTWAQSAAV